MLDALPDETFKNAHGAVHYFKGTTTQGWTYASVYIGELSLGEPVLRIFNHSADYYLAIERSRMYYEGADNDSN